MTRAAGLAAAEVDELLRLGNLVAQELGRDPQRALEIAERAVSITETMPHDAYPAAVVAQLSAYAWKDLGQSLQHLDRLADALTALDRAELAIAGHHALVHDRAVVRFTRATVLQEVHRYDESSATLAECREVFRERGDQKRLLLCSIAEAVLLHRLQRYREAREAYLLLLAGNGLEADATASLLHLIRACSPTTDRSTSARTSRTARD